MSEPSTVPPASVVLVSGGSRGLGLAIVTDLLASGLKVAAFARTVTPELTALGEKYPDHLYYGSVDINDAAAGQAFVKAVETQLGPIDALVNNAAIGQDSLHVHTSADHLAEIIQTNLTSPLILTRFVLRRMLAKGLKGRIVNVTSICAQRGYPGLVAYSATKGAWTRPPVHSRVNWAAASWPTRSRRASSPPRCPPSSARPNSTRSSAAPRPVT